MQNKLSTDKGEVRDRVQSNNLILCRIGEISFEIFFKGYPSLPLSHVPEEQTPFCSLEYEEFVVYEASLEPAVI